MEDGTSRVDDPAQLSAELQGLHDQFDRIREDADALCDGLSERQVSWRPGPNRWSVVECLEHLNQTASKYLSAIDNAIERAEAREQFGTGPFRYGWFGQWFVRQLEPPPRRAFKAPSGFAPASELSVSDVRSRFALAQRDLQTRLYRADGVHLARAKVTSPVSRFIRFELGQCFNVVASHERRHLWQARRVCDAAGFPT